MPVISSWPHKVSYLGLWPKRQKYASQHSEVIWTEWCNNRNVVFDGHETLISENKAGEMTQVTTERESKWEEREGAVSGECCVRIAISKKASHSTIVFSIAANSRHLYLLLNQISHKLTLYTRTYILLPAFLPVFPCFLIVHNRLCQVTFPVRTTEVQFLYGIKLFFFFFTMNSTLKEDIFFSVHNSPFFPHPLRGLCEWWEQIVGLKGEEKHTPGTILSTKFHSFQLFFFLLPGVFTPFPSTSPSSFCSPLIFSAMVSRWC